MMEQIAKYLLADVYFQIQLSANETVFSQSVFTYPHLDVFIRFLLTHFF